MKTKEPKNIKDKLAEGAKKIRALTKKPAKKNPPKDGTLTKLPPAGESSEAVADLLAKHVIIAEDGTSLRLSDNIEIGEYIPIYDAVVSESKKAQDKADKFQFVLGDLYREGKRLFGKEFAVLMAANGRPVSTLKKWASIADSIDLPLRNLHPALTWSHVAEVAKVPRGSDKLAILDAAAARATAGDIPTVKEIRKEADKFKPRKKKATKKKAPAPEYEMTPDEDSIYAEFLGLVQRLNGDVDSMRKSLKKLLPKLTGTNAKALRDTLEPIVELSELLAKLCEPTGDVN